MGTRGSEQRLRSKQLMVRMTTAEHERLMDFAGRDGSSAQDYLRARIGEPAASSGNAGRDVLTDSDRVILAGCTRSLGHLTGMIKRAVFELPSFQRPSQIEDILTDHGDELKSIQAALRAFVKARSE